MMNMRRLTARVAAINRANRVAMELYPKLLAVFAPLVGSQIRKQDGEFLARVKKLLPAFPEDERTRVYRLSSEYSLAFVVKTSESDSDHSCLYHETVLYIGNVRNGFLTAGLAQPPDFRFDYTVEEISEKRRVYEAAKKVADDAKDALHPFGEYDR